MANYDMQEELEAQASQRKLEEETPFYADRRQMGFDGFSRFRFFNGPNDQSIADEIRVYERQGWVLKDEGYRKWKDKEAYALEFRPTFKHACQMRWAKLKWDLFGEIKGLVWMLAIYGLAALLALAGFIIGVTWLVMKVVHLCQ